MNLHALRVALAISLLLAAPGPGRAQDISVTPPGAPDPAVRTDMSLPQPVRRQIDAFFNGLGLHQVGESYDTLVKGTKIGQRTEDVELLKAKTQQAITMFGDVIGYDQVSVKHLGPHLLLATCLSLGKDFPLRWKFYYYTPNGDDAWRLLDIRVDDQLADMFGERPASVTGAPAAAAPAPAAP